MTHTCCITCALEEEGKGGEGEAKVDFYVILRSPPFQYTCTERPRLSASNACVEEEEGVWEKTWAAGVAL